MEKLHPSPASAHLWQALRNKKGVTLMYKLGLPQERQLTTPRLVDDHPRPESSHPEVRGCPPQDQQMTDHPSRPQPKCWLLRGSPQESGTLFIAWFSGILVCMPGIICLKSCKGKLTKEQGTECGVCFAEFSPGLWFSCCQWQIYLVLHVIFINKNQFPLPT